MLEYFDLNGKKLEKPPTTGEFLEKRCETWFYINLDIYRNDIHLIVDGKYVFQPVPKPGRVILTEEPFKKK